MTEIEIVDQYLKSNSKAKKIFFTGSHGTGKTTSVFNIARHLKMKYSDKSIQIITENAKHSPFPINKKTTKESQLWIFSNQLSRELEYSVLYDICIGDRTIIDPLAYTKHSGFYDIFEALEPIAKLYIETYDLILFKHIDKNEYHFEDGVRDSTDKDYRKKINDILLDLYLDYSKKYNFAFEVI